MSTRAKLLILHELTKLGVRKSERDSSAMIPCPFHNEQHPSGGVNLNEALTVPLGWFHCLGCDASKPWNELAQKLGLRQINGEIKRKTQGEDFIPPSEYKYELLNSNTPEETFEEQMKKFTFFDEFKEEKWRGFSTEFLEKMGCRFIYYDLEGRFYVWFPVQILGKLEGYVRATLTKPEDNTSSYYNAPGRWSHSKGLLFFDQAVTLMRELGLKTIVLCEGPRDALRLLKNKIPSICIVGALNWTNEKRFTLEQTGAEHLILMMDGDLKDKNGHIAGKRATQKIYRSTKSHFETKYFSLWKYAEKLGKKIDPFNCSFEFIRKVRAALK
jgi:DNA primase